MLRTQEPQTDEIIANSWVFTVSKPYEQSPVRIPSSPEGWKCKKMKFSSWFPRPPPSMCSNWKSIFFLGSQHIHEGAITRKMMLQNIFALESMLLKNTRWYFDGLLDYLLSLTWIEWIKWHVWLQNSHKQDFRRKRLKTVCEHWTHFDVKFNEVKVFWIKLKKNRRNIALGFTMKVKITLSLHWSDHTSDLHFTGMLLKIVDTENGENRRISFLKITCFGSSR